MNKSQITGASYVLTSALFFSTYGIWSKLMSHSFGEFSQAWTRGLIMLAVIIPIGIIRKDFQKIAQKDLKWFVLISLIGGLNQAPYFLGFKYLPVGTATLLFYAFLTLGSFIFGRLFFAEVINRPKQLAFLLSLAGMFLIYKFYLLPTQIIPALLTAIAGLMGATFVVFSKKLSNTYSEIQILSSDFFVVFFGNLAISVIIGDHLPNLTLSVPWIAQFGYAGAMLLANAAVIAGFAKLEPSIGGLIGLAEILFGIFFGVIFFGEILTLPMIFGAGLILLGMILPQLKELKLAKI